MKGINGLDHTKWRCQYHVVFAPKYRRQVIYREIRADIGFILRKLCEQKGVEIIEANACPDHIHMLISIPPKYSVSQIIGYLKGKSSLPIFDSMQASSTNLVTGIWGRKDRGADKKVGLNTRRKEIWGCIQMNNTAKLSRFMRKRNQ